MRAPSHPFPACGVAVGMIRQFHGPLVALALMLPAPVWGQSSWLYEIRGGVLAHDVPIVAAGRWESGVSLNAELAFTPSLPLFGGAIRPVIGGSFTPNFQTSWAYV